LGKPTHVGGTNTGAVMSGRSAACRVFIAPAREAAWARKKRKEVEASVPARIKSSGLVARTSQ